MPVIRLTVLCTALALLSACGGSSSNDDNDDDGNGAIILNSLPGLDGEIRAAGDVDSTGEIMRIGLLQSGAQYRAFVTFDISQFNVNDNVDAAGISLPFISQTGSPFTTLGDIIVEDVELGGSLSPTDYDAPLVNGATTLDRFSHVADVGTIVQAAISNDQNRLTFRFRFMNLLAPAGTFVTYAQSENPLPAPFLSVVLGEPNL